MCQDYFTKIIAATWSINKIIPVSIALTRILGLLKASMISITFVVQNVFTNQKKKITFKEIVKSAQM